MPAPDGLEILEGKWEGTNQLWLDPEGPVRESASEAEIETIAHGQFAEIRYSWAYEGQEQEGRLILGQDREREIVTAVWFDTWHMIDQFMVCEGAVDQGGVVRVRGSYVAPPGPDWGWKISIERQDADAFCLLMHNISPEGEEGLAVKVNYKRKN